MKPLFLGAGTLLFLVIISGCTQSPFGNSLVGVWETKVLGFTQTISFETNNTGVLVTTLHQEAFEYQLLNNTTLRYRIVGQNDWTEKSYEMVNTNTLKLERLTWTRKGSV